MSTELKTLSTVEIVDVYNKQAKKLGQKPVKRFANRETAVKRTKAMLAISPSKPSAAAPKKATAAKKSNGRPSKELNLKPRANGKEIRDGSLAEKVMALLKKGTTRDQLAKAIGGDNAAGRVRTLLLRMNEHNGVGITQSGDKYKSVAR